MKDRPKRSCKLCGEDITNTHGNTVYCWVCGPPKLVFKRQYSKQEASHKIVKIAVDSKILPKVRSQECVDCGKPARHYDHRDYMKPLEVEPVCISCNFKRGPALNNEHIQ